MIMADYRRRITREKGSYMSIVRRTVLVLIVVLLSSLPVAASAHAEVPIVLQGETDPAPNGQVTEDILVWIVPEAPTQAARGEEISVVVKSVWIPGTNPVGWEYDLTYDPSLLTFVRAEPVLPAVTPQTTIPCTAAFNDQGDHVATAIACGPFVAVSLAEYWFQVNNSAEGSIVVDVNNAIVIGSDLSTVPSMGQSDSIDIIDVFELGVCGDHNGDGDVTVLDAVLNLFYIVGDSQTTSDQRFLADVDRDGLTTVIDVITILRHIVGLTAISSCGPPEHVRECPQGPSVTIGEPLIGDADWAQHPNNVLIYDVTADLNGEGEIWAEYWPLGSSAPKLSSQRTSVDTHHELQIMRLRADTTYCIQVYALPTAAGPTAQVNPIPDLRGGTFTTASLPTELEAGTFAAIEGRLTSELTAITHPVTGFSGVIMIDQDGELVWYREGPGSGIEQKPNYNLLIGPENRNTLTEIRPDGTIVNQITDIVDGEICANGRWHHEMLYIGDDKALTIGSEVGPFTFDAAAAAAARGFVTVADETLGELITSPLGLGGTVRDQTGDTIELWDIDAGTITRLISLFDVLDPTVERTLASSATGGGFFRLCDKSIAPEDWSHANALWKLQDGNIMMSARHLNAVIAMDTDADQIVWQLGGVGSHFTFPDPSDRFYHQHSPKELANGNILLFDNGNTRPEAEGGEYTRALELELDFDNLTATKVWEYRHSPDLFAFCCSNVTRLDNGNSLLVFGSTFEADNCCRMYVLAEADPIGGTVARTIVSAPGKNVQYRVYPFDTINGEFELAQEPPETVEGLMLWIEADAIGGVDDGDPVGTWVDKSGNGRHATQSASVTRPTFRAGVANGMPGVEFDGIDAFMSVASLPIPSDTTIFVVATNTEQNSGGSVFRPILAASNDPFSPTGNGYGLGYRRSGASGFTAAIGDGTSQTNLNHLNASTGLAELHTFTKSGTSGTMYLNGSEVASTVFNRTSGFHTGSYNLGRDINNTSRTYKGTILEIIVYNQTLTTAERTTIEAYLGIKYGLFQ